MKYLQGRVNFPTGGKVREPKGMIRCNSGTDSIVWMEEDVRLYFAAPERYFLSGDFLFRR